MHNAEQEAMTSGVDLLAAKQRNREDCLMAPITRVSFLLVPNHFAVIIVLPVRAAGLGGEGIGKMITAK